MSLSCYHLDMDLTKSIIENGGSLVRGRMCRQALRFSRKTGMRGVIQGGVAREIEPIVRRVSETLAGWSYRRDLDAVMLL